MDSLREAFDSDLYFFDKEVSIGGMYGVMAVSVVALVAVYVLLSGRRAK